MRHYKPNSYPNELEFGPQPKARADSILQGHQIGEICMSSAVDRLHASFDHENWGGVRLAGAMPLREMMTRMDNLCRQNTNKYHCVLLPLAHEAWCAIKDVICPNGEPVSEMQIRRHKLEHKRGAFTNTRSGPEDDIQHLHYRHAPMLLGVWEPNSGLTVHLHAFHRLRIPDDIWGLDPSHPKMLAFAERLLPRVFPPYQGDEGEA